MFYFLLLFDNMIIHVQFMKMMIRFEHGLAVADPGFDLSGGVDLVNGGGGGGGGGRKCRKSLKVLKVEVKVIFSVFLAIFLLKSCLKLVASEASEEKIEKK